MKNGNHLQSFSSLETAKHHKESTAPQLSLCGKMQAILGLDVSRFGLNGTHFAPNTGEGKDDIRVNWRDFRYNFQK